MAQERDSNQRQLDVHLAGHGQVATVSAPYGRSDEFRWRYLDTWAQTGFAVSPHLQLTGEIPSLAAKHYLENLLPEGPALDEILSRGTLQRGDALGLLELIGEDTAGALIFVPAGTQPAKRSFTPLPEQELAGRIRQHIDLAAGLTTWGGQIRLSVAGVQDKINLLQLPDGTLGFGDGQLCSNRIFKPETGRVPNIVINELLTMELARAVGFEVAPVQRLYLDGIPTLCVDRFDRYWDPDQRQVLRRHVIDGCQATGLPSSHKYERQFGDGPDVRHCRDGVSFSLLHQVPVANPEQHTHQLALRMLFNAAVTNTDLHGKNLSYFVDHAGLRLAPAYDLVCIGALNLDGTGHTADHRSNSTPMTLPMSIGDHHPNTTGNFQPPVTALMLADYADEFGIPAETMQQWALSITSRIEQALGPTVAQCQQLPLTQAERDHLAVCQQVISASCHLLATEAANIMEMSALL
ncbi:serine/threonine-protein kinase HipA [Ferrimonas marina]|uniref:Serine/threonine-protein kinase HipA n=2 Tax=Ferrimonas marina TaxID=299255 RepID=A0A1M5TST8_9GAMM|nr:serine/threonine-protein kinase HipA [Ferrimonas marina]